jgi:hypothetical protein
VLGKPFDVGSPSSAALVVSVGDSQIMLKEGHFPQLSSKGDYTINRAGSDHVSDGKGVLVVRLSAYFVDSGRMF